MTAMDTRTGIRTVRVVEPETEPEVAEMTVAPTPPLIARPWLPGVLLIAATATFDELQVTEVVRFCVLPSV